IQESDLPMPRLQVNILDTTDGGRPARSDFFWAGYGVFGEVEAATSTAPAMQSS
ncbi:MAG: hypothetical protein JWM76_2168, partial [Pseudonocardiales bacterium]|nr:hypothetical protein [Pseudonocardiales bacterium]